jgi:hypothetical protein
MSIQVPQDFKSLQCFNPVNALGLIGNATLALHHHMAPARCPWDPEDDKEKKFAGAPEKTDNLSQG